VNHLTAEFQVPEAGMLTAEIRELSGRKVHSETMHCAAAGSCRRTIQLPSLSPGVYLLALELNGKITSARFLVAPPSAE
jgi:hypothetical protein